MKVFTTIRETVLEILNSVFKGSRADVGADVGLVPVRRGCGRGFGLGAIGVRQKTSVEGFARVRFSQVLVLFPSWRDGVSGPFQGQRSTIGP